MDRRQALRPEQRSGLWLTALVIGGVVLCALIVQPFMPALVWAVVLALLASPLERRLRSLLGGQAWASATLGVVAVAVAIIAPMLFVFDALVRELLGGAVLANEILSETHWQSVARSQKWLAPAVKWATANVDFGLVLQSVAARVGGWGESLIQGSVNGIVTLLLTLYFLFYLLRDGPRFRSGLATILPLTRTEFDRLSETVGNTIYAAFYGTVAVSLLQGALAGLMFWWLDLPSPAFWGIIMGVLAIVPFLGAFVVWAPTALALAIGGDFASAIILTLWGVLVVGLIDNIIYPVLVGKRLEMHSLVSFVAIVGGLALFGAHGVVLGPVCVAATWTLHTIWRERRAAALAASQA
ncbi:AI-2E family transporter [Novosphingobium sp.]|uniref:AI-2E family transporter n=1 Tax=Novosphingobium sp. TaxID=1874826 RepID=UPI0035B437EE